MKRPPLGRLKSVGILVPALLLLPVGAWGEPAAPVASSFNVTPLRIELDSKTNFETFQIRNDSNDRLAVQARGFAWDQTDGEDRYAPTADFAISPSIVEIDPGQIQYFRLIRGQMPAKAAEGSYRLIIDQLPDDRMRQGGASSTRLRVSIPVFANRNLASPAVLGWTVMGKSIGVANSGGRSVKLGKLGISTPDGRTYDLSVKGPRYILSGASASFAAPANLMCVPAGSFVTGTIDNAPLREPIPSSCG